MTHRWTIRPRAAGGVLRTRSSVAVLAAVLVVALLGPVAPAAYAAAHSAGPGPPVWREAAFVVGDPPDHDDTVPERVPPGLVDRAP